MPVKHLLWRGSRVGHGPVKDGSFRHDSDDAVRYPLPKDDVLSIGVRLDLGLGLNIEYLQCSTGCVHSEISLLRSRSCIRAGCGRVIHTFKSQNLLVGVHDRGVCGYGPTQNIIGVV